MKDGSVKCQYSGVSSAHLTCSGGGFVHIQRALKAAGTSTRLIFLLSTSLSIYQFHFPHKLPSHFFLLFFTFTPHLHLHHYPSSLSLSEHSLVTFFQSSSTTTVLTYTHSHSQKPRPASYKLSRSTSLDPKRKHIQQLHFTQASSIPSKMKFNVAILLLPAASAFSYSSEHHHHHKSHHHNKTLASGTAPYGLSNGTAAFGSSGLLTASTGIAGKAVYTTVVVTNGPSYRTIVESAQPSLNEAGSSLPVLSSCPQATVTVTTGAIVTVTVTAPENETSPLIPTQAPVPVQSSIPSPVESPIASPTVASSSTLLQAVNSAMTLGAVGAEPSSSTSTPVVADTPKTVAAAPVVVPTSSASPIAKAAATSAAAPAAAPASTSGKSPKRGIIVSGADTNAQTAAFANTKVSWLGNWYSGPPPNLTPDMGMEYVPQLYSPQYITDGSWASNAKKGIAAGDKYFMSFGEPDTSDITAEAAVTYWMANMEPYAAQGVSLGAPGNLQNPRDMEWLATFLKGCETAGCTIGFLCVHWFWTPGPNGQQDFKNAVTNVTTQANGRWPVWVDNFEANGDAAGQIEFLTNVIPWLEDNDAIARYGYLALNRTQGGFLPETGDELSDLGKFYATF